MVSGLFAGRERPGVGLGLVMLLSTSPAVSSVVWLFVRVVPVSEGAELSWVDIRWAVLFDGFVFELVRSMSVAVSRGLWA